MFFFLGGPTPPGKFICCFFSIELLFDPFRMLPPGVVGIISLQQRIIFSNKKTWYSRSMSIFITMKMSSNRSSPKLDR